MAFKDNREFINALERHGELVRIKQQVDWDLEAGAIVRRCCELKGPAAFFENVKDYPGFQMFGAFLNTPRKLAIALGLNPGTSIRELQNAYLKKTSGKPVPPVVVGKKKAPCKDNVLLGADAKLFHLPAPMVHEGDGGRYIGTWHFVVAKDPDDGAVNWGMYRQMAFDDKTMVGLVLPGSDMGRMFYNKYVPKNKSMPFATVIGPDPLSGVAGQATAAIPETEFAGLLRGEPVELVKCETCDLEVPAHAEIVIEGEVLPYPTLPEGPFGEYTGFRTSPRAPRTVYRVKAITYRDNPIMTVSNMGVPTDEGQFLRSFTMGLELKRFLLDMGLPIPDVHMPPEAAHHMIIVAVKPTVNNIATNVANLIFGHKIGFWLAQVIVVDDTVDIFRWDEVIHALATRCHPVRGVRVYEHSVGAPLMPYCNLKERVEGRIPKILFDCIFPLEWSREVERPALVSFEANYPEEIKKRVLNNWKKYGFKE